MPCLFWDPCSEIARRQESMDKGLIVVDSATQQSFIRRQSAG